MAQPTAPRPAPAHRRLPPLPGGVVQHREGVERCGGCHAEVISARRLDGTLIHVSVVFGREHACIDRRAE